MSTENHSAEPEQLSPKTLTFGDVHDLIIKLKKAFSQKLGKPRKDKAWENSDDPEALLIKNLQNLYDCHRKIHLDSDADSDDEDFFENIKKCDKWLKNPLKHLLLREENPNPHITEFLDAFFDKEKIQKSKAIYQTKKDIITLGDIKKLLRSLKKEFSQKMNGKMKDKIWNNSDSPNAKLIRKIERILSWNKKSYKDNLKLNYKYEEDDALFFAMRCEGIYESMFDQLITENSGTSVHIESFLNQHYSEHKIKILQKDKDIPRITFGDINTLLEMLKNDFKDKINKEYWVQSSNPTAVLLKNMEILYQDSRDDYLYYGETILNIDDDASNIYTRTNDQFHQTFSLQASKKILRSVFKWGSKAPQALQFLKDRYGQVLIEKLEQEHALTQKEKGEKSMLNTICIDDVLHQEHPDFIKFVGRAKNVRVSTDQKKIEVFLQAIEKPHFFKEKIFKDPQILTIALTACRNRKITEEQYNVFAEWIELRKVYGKKRVQIHRILNKSGEFTVYAKKHLLKYIFKDKEEGFEKPLMRDDNFEQFKERLKKLPASSQVFVTLDSAKLGYFGDTAFAFYAFPGIGTLGKNSDFVSILPISMYQCWMDTAFPPAQGETKSRITLKARLGEVSMEDIEHAHKIDEQPVSTYYPRASNEHTPSSYRHFHQHGSRTTTIIGAHDKPHGMVMANINKKALRALELAADTIRNTLYEKNQKAYSTGLWKLADIVLFDKVVSENKNPADAFLALLENAYPRHIFMAEEAAVLIDIYFHPEKWSTFINSNKFTSSKNRYWKSLEKYGNLFNAEDDIKFNIFKLSIISELTEKNKSADKIKSALIDCNKAWEMDKENLLKNIAFKKQKKDFYNKLEKKNEEKIFGYIAWKGKIVSQNNVNSILQDFTADIPEKKFSNIRQISINFNFSNEELVNIFYNDPKEFKLNIMDNNFDLNEMINNQLETFLHLAVKNNNLDMIIFLIKHGADVNLKDKHGNSPVFYPLNKQTLFDESIREHYKTAAILIQFGAEEKESLKNIFKSFSPQNDEEWEFARIFIEHGADVTQKKTAFYDDTASKLTLLDAAIAAGKSDIASLISRKIQKSHSHMEKNDPTTSIKNQKSQAFFKPEKQKLEEPSESPSKKPPSPGSG